MMLERMYWFLAIPKQAAIYDRNVMEEVCVFPSHMAAINNNHQAANLVIDDDYVDRMDIVLIGSDQKITTKLHNIFPASRKRDRGGSEPRVSGSSVRSSNMIPTNMKSKEANVTMQQQTEMRRPCANMEMNACRSSTFKPPQHARGQRDYISGQRALTA